MTTGDAVQEAPVEMRAPFATFLDFDGDPEAQMEMAIPILPADDLRVARAFYVDQLGFAVRFEATDDGVSGLLGLARGGILLTIDAPMTGHGRGACVSFQVDSADRYYDEWRTRVEIPRPPRDEAWGARTFSVHDPSGNTLFVMGPVS
jgi:catechol 2,3-dioxygenase-like lactoylglutathione lyase family enzyme